MSSRKHGFTRPSLFKIIIWVLIVFYTLNISMLYLAILLDSIATGWYGTILPEGYTITNYYGVVTRFDMLKITINTVTIALSVSLMSVAVGVISGYGLNKVVRSFPVRALFIMPLILPTIVYGVPLASIFFRTGIAGTFIAAVLINLVPNSTFATFILAEYYSTVPRELEEAAAVLGASKVKRIYHVLLPQITSGIITALIVTFARAFNEVLLTYLVIGPEIITLPVLLFVQQTGSPVLTRHEMAALGTLVLLPGLIFLIIAIKILKVRIAFFRV